MKFIRKNIKIISIIVILLFIVFLVILKIYLNNNINVEEELVVEQNKIEKKEEEFSDKNEVVIKKIFVDIKGAIKKPGVYEIEENKKVIDQTTPNMIQKLNLLFARKPVISKEL